MSAALKSRKEHIIGFIAQWRTGGFSDREPVEDTQKGGNWIFAIQIDRYILHPQLMTKKVHLETVSYLFVYAITNHKKIILWLVVFLVS